MRAEQNELLTRIGPGTRCGRLLRSYWQPVALLDEFDPALDPAMAIRAVKAVRVLGLDLVLFRDVSGPFGLLDRDCPHRGADLAFGRNEGDGLRCPFHGWKFDRQGQCLETPGEPDAPTEDLGVSWAASWPPPSSELEPPELAPPAPVLAPGNGLIAVGWLWVSTFISTCAVSLCF